MRRKKEKKENGKKIKGMLKEQRNQGQGIIIEKVIKM